MSEPNPQQEPSMEEILASIRRIISEDGEEGAPAAKAEEPVAEAAAEPAAGAEEDVLELTQVVDEAAEEPEPKPEPEQQDEMAAVMEATESEAEEEAELPGPPEEPDLEALPKEDDEIELREELAQAAPAPSSPSAEGSALISDQPAAAATGSLSNLVAAVDMAHAGTPIGHGGRTIEDLVKEVMRPMIREWLDANLPGLVERLVAKEISRLSRHAEGED